LRREKKIRIEEIRKELKGMKKFEVEIKGVSPILYNRVQTVGIQTKKGEGFDKPEDCESKLHIRENKICQPAIGIELGLQKVAGEIKRKGAGTRNFKNLFKSSVFIKPLMIPHLIQKWEPLETTTVNQVTKGRIIVYRPMLNDWALKFEVEVLDDRISTEVLKLALDDTGRLNGLGDWRPRYGRFIVTKFKEL